MTRNMIRNSDVTQDHRPLRSFQLLANGSRAFSTYRVNALMYDPLVSLHIRWELPTIQFTLQPWTPNATDSNLLRLVRAQLDSHGVND